MFFVSFSISNGGRSWSCCSPGNCISYLRTFVWIDSQSLSMAYVNTAIARSAVGCSTFAAFCKIYLRLVKGTSWTVLQKILCRVTLFDAAISFAAELVRFLQQAAYQVKSRMQLVIHLQQSTIWQISLSIDGTTTLHMVSAFYGSNIYPMVMIIRSTIKRSSERNQISSLII